MTYPLDHAERHGHDDTELGRDCQTAWLILANSGLKVEIPSWLTIDPGPLTFA